jgi:LysR family transcriptional regulator (chromosome initiation inhibitor)
VLVDLFWHHWDIEPPLAQDISRLIVQEARRQLLPYRQRETALVEAA